VDGDGGGEAPDGTPIDLTGSYGLLNLIEEEGGTHGGHTLRDHVGKSEMDLRNALAKRLQGLIADGSADRAYGLFLGSFSSLGAANKLTSSTLAVTVILLTKIYQGLLMD
jgi:hypothetical protein